MLSGSRGCPFLDVVYNAVVPTFCAKRPGCFPIVPYICNHRNHIKQNSMIIMIDIDILCITTGDEHVWSPTYEGFVACVFGASLATQW